MTVSQGLVQELLRGDGACRALHSEFLGAMSVRDGDAVSDDTELKGLQGTHEGTCAVTVTPLITRVDLTDLVGWAVSPLPSHHSTSIPPGAAYSLKGTTFPW